MAFKFNPLTGNLDLVGSGGGGGSGPFTGITGTPDQIAYFDALGNGTGDTQATRLSDSTKQTDIEANTFAQNSFPDNSGDQGTVQADAVGAGGNAIQVTFDGATIDVDTAVATWNAANPGNTCSVVSGGTTIPSDAGTFNLIGGGTTKIGIGEIAFSLIGSDIHGIGIVSQDPTNNLNALNINGNLSSLFGTSEFGTLSGFVDDTVPANPKISITINADGVGQFFVTDSSSYSSIIQLSDVDATINHNGAVIGIDGANSSFVIGDNTTAILIPFGLTANLNDVLTVTGVNGNEYTLGFAAAGGGGTPAGADKDVQFNDSGVFGGDSNFTFNKTDINFTVGDKTFAANGTIFQVTDLGKQINGIAQEVQFSRYAADTTTQVPFLRGRNSDLTTIIGDVDAKENTTRIVIDQKSVNTNTITAAGSRKTDYSSTSFTAGGSPGPNSNLADAALLPSYNGNNTNTGFSATITHLDVQRVDFSSFTGTFPSNGDTIVAGGVSGTVYDGDSLAMNLWIENITGGVFVPADFLIGPFGFTAVVTSTDYNTVHDRYDFVNGTNSLLNQPCLTTPFNYIQGTNFSFQNATGHGVGDIWATTVSVNFGNMLIMNGYAGQYILGDPSNLSSQNQTYLDIDDSAGAITTNSKGFIVQDDVTGFRSLAADNINIVVQIGDVDNSVNGTVLTIDDQNNGISGVANYFGVAGGIFYGTNLHNNSLPNGTATQQDIRSGTYTPTLTGVTNVDTATANVFQWMRVGNVVTVSGSIEILPLAGGTTELEITLPVASAIADATNVSGIGKASYSTINAGAVLGGVTNDVALYVYTDSSVSSKSHFFTFTYVVI